AGCQPATRNTFNWPKPFHFQNTGTRRQVAAENGQVGRSTQTHRTFLPNPKKRNALGNKQRAFSAKCIQQLYFAFSACGAGVVLVFAGGAALVPGPLTRDVVCVVVNVALVLAGAVATAVALAAGGGAGGRSDLPSCCIVFSRVVR